MQDQPLFHRNTTDNDDAASLAKVSPVIDRITKTNVRLYYLVYISLTIIFIIQASQALNWRAVSGGMTAGIIIWSLTEYLMHRFFFHWKPRNQIEKMLVYILHDVHHAHPREVPRSITPLMISLPLAAIFYLFFHVAFGKYAATVFPGFLSGYLIYTIIHDSTHHFPMNYPVAKQLKRHHMRHHYFDNGKNFGVSSPLWDYVFKTRS